MELPSTHIIASNRFYVKNMPAFYRFLRLFGNGIGFEREPDNSVNLIARVKHPPITSTFLQRLCKHIIPGHVVILEDSYYGCNCIARDVYEISASDVKVVQGGNVT